jgi:hypothetical protein
MRLGLDEAIELAAVSEFGSTLSDSNLSKLKPCFKLKSAVAARNFCSRPYLCSLIFLDAVVDRCGAASAEGCGHKSIQLVSLNEYE